jgi:ABC-type Zn uptake system ZnuABC Zn-binding protein ZnuA
MPPRTSAAPGASPTSCGISTASWRARSKRFRRPTAVTSHDALGYLADRYGLTVVATAFPVTGPEGEASASQLAEVEDTIAAYDVPAVFAGEEEDPEVLRLVAENTGVEVVDDLLIESPGEAGTYVEMLRHDTEQIASALGG